MHYYFFVLKEEDTLSTVTYETDIIGVRRMTYHSQLGDDSDTLNTIWQFFKNGTIEVISDGFKDYEISADEICFTGLYYPTPRCYEYGFFGPSADLLTLQSDVETITFIRIV